MSAAGHASAWVLCCGTLAGIGPCLSPPTSLGPTRLTSSRPPSEVIATATRVLESAGFQVSTSDVTAGSVVATRIRSPEQQGGDLACTFGRGSREATGGTATMTLRVTAQSAGHGSQIVMTAHVRTAFPQLASNDSPSRSNDTDCVSTGAIEKRIADAMQ